jgi:hypothetical protein
MAEFNNGSNVSSSDSLHNLSVESDIAPHDLNERVNDIDNRLTDVETLLATQSQLASNSFASNGRSLHMSDLLRSTQNSIISGSQHSATLPIGNSVYPLGYSNISPNGSASTVVRGHGPGGKRRKTKKQKKTKKRGNKGKKLTKRNRK